MSSVIESINQVVREGDDQALMSSPALARLQSLAEMSATRLRGGASLAARMTSEAIAVLGAQLCTVQEISASDKLQTIGFSRAVHFNESWVERITSSLAGEVIVRRGAFSVSELSHYLRERNLPVDERINHYYGVPLCDAIGRPLGVASLFSNNASLFAPENKLWLTAAVRLVCDALKIDHLEAKARESLPMWAPAEAPVEQTVGANTPGPQSKKGTVLVIDDDRSFNHVICNYLKDEGYFAESAFDGLEAMRVFRPHDFHLVMTDVAMPNMNGWELIAALRVRAPQIPIVLITAYNRGMWSENHLRDNGVSAVLNKPFELENLLTVLADLSTLR